MEKGIDLDSFYELNKTIYNSCDELVRLEGKDDEESKAEREKLLDNLYRCTSSLADDSNGRIRTDDEDMIGLFNSLYSYAGTFKQSLQLISHYKSESKKDLANDDFNKLSDNAKMVCLTQLRLNNTIKCMLNKSGELEELRQNKK